MKKYILSVLMLIGSVGLVSAQDESTGSGSGSAGYAPAAGDFSGAILYGRGLFITSGLNVPASVTATGTVSGSSPSAFEIFDDNNSAVNMMGGEARYFVTDQIAVRLGGAAIIRNTPDRPNIQAPYPQNSTSSATAIPHYAAVQAENSVDLTVNLTGEYHFTSKYERLFPYVGLNLPFFHGRRSLYDPSVYSPSTGTTGTVQIVDAGPRHVQLFGFGAQATAGVDYYLMEGFFFGFEIRPVSYVYLYTSKMPAPGLEELQADTHTISIFSQPLLKVGFRF